MIDIAETIKIATENNVQDIITGFGMGLSMSVLAGMTGWAVSASIRLLKSILTPK